MNMTTTYNIVGNRCVLTFCEPCEVFCRALAESNMFGGTTITQTFTQISFYAKSVCSLRSFLSQRREKLQYNEGMKLAQCLGQQLFYLEKRAHTFSWFDTNHVLVIDDSTFFCIDVEQLMPIDSLGRIWFTAPFSVKLPHLAPEIKRLLSLPSHVAFTAVYYSLGSLITFCLTDTEGAEPSAQLLEFIAQTKLYWFLLRCIDADPGARKLLIV